MPLTNTACNNAKRKEKPYKLSDSEGMYLEVMPNGSKYWRLKYRHLGKEKRLALGVYPEVSLADARNKRSEARKLIASDIDPSLAKKREKLKSYVNAANTFETVAREWHENQKERWSRAYPGKVMRCLEKHLFPYIGNLPISEISPPEILECLRRIEKDKKLDMASTMKQLSGQIFRYGIQTGKCERDPSADLRGALKIGKTKHYAAIEAKDIPDFLKALEKNDARLFSRTQRAIRLSLLVFARPGEIRQAQWSEINFETETWTIPAEKMKMRRDHIIPLSKQAVTVLKEQQEETGYLDTDWVFPSQVRPKQAMSDGTVTRAIERLGYGDRLVAHGFRALARTTIREQLGYDSEVIEKQLAHKTKNPLGEAYDRTQFLDKRKKMMQHWADFLDAVASNGKIVVSNNSIF